MRRLRWPYAGPPTYGPDHPTWGFPPVALLRHQAGASGSTVAGPRGPVGLTAGIALCIVTGLAALVAAGAEAARFGLLLGGRTRVLDAAHVRVGDIAVQVSAWAAVVLGVGTAACAAAAVVSLCAAAAHRAGVRPPRPPAASVARMLVPGWNLHGAGQVLVETFRLVHRSGSPGASETGAIPRGTRRLIIAWWSAWIVNGAITVAALALSFGSSVQERADAVQLHVVLDVVAASVAVLSAAVLMSLRRAWRGRAPRRYRTWLVAPPPSSAANRTVRSGSADLGRHAGQHRRR